MWLEVESPRHSSTDASASASAPPELPASAPVAETIPILQDVPVKMRVKTKKEYFGGPMMNFELDVELEEVVASLTRPKFKSCQARSTCLPVVLAAQR